MSETVVWECLDCSNKCTLTAEKDERGNCSSTPIECPWDRAGAKWVKTSSS